MAKAVLTHKPVSGYDDLPEERYHFPRTYLNAIRAAVGDQVVFYEPRRIGAGETTGGRQAYVAAAKIAAIVPDPDRPDHFYARIEDYIGFDHPVPYRHGDQFFEAALRGSDGAVNLGAFQRAVRALPERDFELILQAGFDSTLATLTREQPPAIGPDPPAVYLDRPIAELVTRRPVRDAAFAAAVRDAYDRTCAFTGLKIINGGGRPEVEAAHIRPVEEHGPDSVRNGIALCRTAHWLFDRNLITLTDDFHIRVSRSLAANDVLRMFRLDRPVPVPSSPELRPHQVYLRHHQSRFKA